MWIKVRGCGSRDCDTGLLLKILAPAISESLSFFLNSSLTSGQVPNNWKKNINILHIQKRFKSDLGNYGPIALLSVISLLLDRIVHNHDSQIQSL